VRPLFHWLPLPVGSPPPPRRGEDRSTFDAVVFTPTPDTPPAALVAVLTAARNSGYRYREVYGVTGTPAELHRAGANVFVAPLPPGDALLSPGAVALSRAAQRAVRFAAAAARLGPSAAAAAHVSLPPRATPRQNAALGAALAMLSDAGVRHLHLSSGERTDRDPARLLHGVPRDALTAFTTVTLAGHGLVHGEERHRPPVALPFDGDPYVFRASARGLPRTLLLHPPRHREPLDRTLYPPLGLARLAAFLRAHGYPVDIIDLDALALRSAEIQTALTVFAARERPVEAVTAAAARLLALVPAHLLDGAGVVGLDVVDPHEDYQVTLVEALLQRLAKTHPGATRVVGGDSAEVEKLAQRCAGHEKATGALLADGQGELFLLGLLNRLEFRDRPARVLVNRALPAGPGQSACRHQDRAPVVELPRRRLPVPDFRPHADDPPAQDQTDYTRGPSSLLQAFLAGEGSHLPTPPRLATLPYQMIAGCNAHCVFCNYPRRMDMRPPRQRGAPRWGRSRRRPASATFFLLNPTLNITPGYAHRFADELIRLDRGLLWMDSARPVGIDARSRAKLKAAGCVLAHLRRGRGLRPLLGRCGKGSPSAEVEASLHGHHARGILNRFNLIVGFPHETDEDVSSDGAGF
jgi:hypothetical protein